MTEAEWLATTDVPTLLRWTVPRGTRRQLRLYLCGGCRVISWLFYHPASLRAVDAAERHADGQISSWDFSGAIAESELLMEWFAFEEDFWRDPVDDRDEALRCLIALGALPAGFRYGTDRWELDQVVKERVRAAADLAFNAIIRVPDWELGYVSRQVEHCIRDFPHVDWPGRWLVDCIYGNPFRPPTVRPEWRTPTVLAIAAGVYADRAYDRLPVLADALEDAGCDAAELLAHCRGVGPHVRGCWVVDRVLDKPDEPIPTASPEGAPQPRSGGSP